MNESLEKLVQETTKAVKLIRILLIFTVIFYVVVTIIGALGLGGAAYFGLLPPVPSKELFMKGLQKTK